MTVEELIKELQKCNPKAILLYSDGDRYLYEELLSFGGPVVVESPHGYYYYINKHVPSTEEHNGVVLA